MKREEVLIADPKEIERIAEILKENIGQILEIGAYRSYTRNFEEKNYFQNWALIRDIYYDKTKDKTFGAVNVAIFKNETPGLESFPIGYITQIADLNMNLLYYRERPTRVNRILRKK